jgi:uncharacterized protein YfbU (UPF0304 family)
VKLTKVERWILANQYKILEQVDPDNVEHYQTMQELLEKGYETEYRWKTQHIYDDDDVVTEEKGHYVINVLAMYDALQQSYQRLADKEASTRTRSRFRGSTATTKANTWGTRGFSATRKRSSLICK